MYGILFTMEKPKDLFSVKARRNTNEMHLINFD